MARLPGGRLAARIADRSLRRAVRIFSRERTSASASEVGARAVAGVSRDAAVNFVFLFLLGLCIGSFLNVCIHRMPRGESIAFPGSRCGSCGKAIRWYDNIPVVSYLVLGGKCRACKAHVSSRYVLVEVLTGVIFAAHSFFFEPGALL